MNTDKAINSTFDFSIYTEGLPCHKFILRTLTSANDAKVFTKNYVATMRRAGMKDSEIESSLLFFSGIARELQGRYDFSSWDSHIEGFSLIDDILFDNEIAIYKTCKQYYRKIDSRYTACALCPFSDKYKNTNIVAEKNIILYALSSQDNLNYILSKGITPEHFVSVTDITARKALSLKPCIYPFYKNTMAALTDPVISKDIFMFAGDYEPVLEQYHSKKIGRLSSIEKDCAFSVNTFCAVMISDMLSGEACERDELDTFIKTLLPEIDNDLSSIMDNNMTSVNSSLSINKSSNLGVDALDDFFNPRGENKQNKKEKSKTPKKSEAVPKKKGISGNAKKATSFVEVTLDSILANMSSLPVEQEEMLPVEPPTLHQNNKSASSDKPISDINNIEKKEKKEPEVIPALDKEPILQSQNILPANLPSLRIPFGSLPIDGYRTAPNYQQPEAAQIRITEITKPNELYTIQDNDMVGVPWVTKEELEHFALNLDSGNSHLLSLFESHIYKDKRLSLEIVCVSNADFYLLLYSPKLHAYFYTKCGAGSVKEILSPILSHRSIEKFCYYPYILLSVLRKMNLRIRGLYSLFSMSRICLGSHSMPMSTALEMLGAVKAVGGITVHKDGEITCMPLQYMHCYHNLYYRNKRQLLRRGIWNQYMTFNTYDIVLGLSYYQNIYSKENAYLFRLQNANGYIFRSKEQSQYKYPGKKLCFYLRYVPDEQNSIIINLLCEMYEKGLFYNTDILLLSMNQSFMSFYIMNKDIEYVETRINRMLLSYLSKTQTRGIEYYVAELTGSELFIKE